MVFLSNVQIKYKVLGLPGVGLGRMDNDQSFFCLFFCQRHVPVSSGKKTDIFHDFTN